MPQFTAYQNQNVQTQKLFPLLLDVQTDLLDELQTRVVVPLASADKSAAKQISRLTPLLDIDGEDYLMLTPQFAGINKNEFGKAVADLSSSRTQIVAALDFLVTGF
jgi:toxin CcdB